MSNLKVLIVGASVAGPTAAYWFAKAGANVTIIERFPKLRTNGQSIDIRTAGVTVMRKMQGMEAAVRAKTTQQEGINFVRDDGRPYAVMKASGDPNQQTLTSEYEIFRGDLAQILYDLTKDNEKIKYVFGEQVASMQQKDDGPIRVEFENGFPTSEYDLVAACDGATSRTRAMGFGCGVRDHIRPLNCWATYFSIKQDLLEGSKMAQLWSTTGGRALGLGPDPSGVNRVGVLGIYPRNNRDLTLPFREAMKQGDDALKHYVAQHFQGTGWKTEEILKGMMSAEDFYASEIVQVKAPSLYKGRFVLVGDAGYSPSPFTGAGTTLAIAGAYTLAGEISRHKGDLAAGLKGYEERMRPMINDLQKIPPGMPALMAPQTAWGIWLRNTFFAFVAWSRILEWAGKFFAGSFGTDKYGLPDYEWEN
ncbi:FAD/NAD(P)-binding domain-containing protein [Rhizodiscina lignyota]|uniref:FAD/NAD(P)-binding domain-containing protein n=1 Tax=Rhizodiscina lignyota TaxID=1504668 RepID=A0A9P4M573_9PEZI|nr:FAD/NAD(P)-binding domain-containing protein [Rhizodiscina lignyota]